MKKNKKIPFVSHIFKHSDFCTKIKLYFSQKTFGEYYDPYEDNYTYTNLNPLTIKGYVSEISSEALVYRHYGLREQGAVEVLTDSKYKNYFVNCNKIVIDNQDYEVFKEGTGNNSLISNRTKKIIRVILTRKGTT